MAARLEREREGCHRIVFTNGVFDIIHRGHVTYLNQAKALGHVLVVGVNMDETVRKLKGPTRPINSLEDRVQVLAGIDAVDFVIPFGEDTPAELLSILKPDMFVKGGDYTRETLPEAQVVESYGGTVHLLPYVENRSTTYMIQRIREVYAAPQPEPAFELTSGRGNGRMTHMALHLSAWTEAENVLCVRLDTLGDVLMTTPALRTLKAGRPGRRITLLTSAAGAAIASLVPEVDEVIVYDAPWLKATAPRESSAPEYAMAERLRGRHFDAAVIFTVYSQNPLPSAVLCYLADIPLRLAYSHENPYQLLTDWVPDPEPAEGIRHEAQRQLDLVAAVGCWTDDQGLSLRVPDRRMRR